MKLHIKVVENGKIVEACFKTFGCGSTIASSSVGFVPFMRRREYRFAATEWVKRKTIEEVLTIKNTRWIFCYSRLVVEQRYLLGFMVGIPKHLNLPPVKLHCSMLAEDAIKAAVKDYEAKRASATAATGDKICHCMISSIAGMMMKKFISVILLWC
ncbi:putative NIF system FeS cluster assembly, NifU [Medicago truncatula]|uniref:Putative NIF system FeS cluster assembly, NifU n=1 Tax=Medicago truncatula TaxID=3880 RepID=A0A396J0M6_MEDTR|nr:putative NIF system FeS cluster assembly, NifU [Medicago truncatula]